MARVIERTRDSCWGTRLSAPCLLQPRWDVYDDRGGHVGGFCKRHAETERRRLERIEKQGLAPTEGGTT